MTGVSGAGKTTVADAVARRLGWPGAEGDDFHSESNVAKMHAGIPLTDDDRRPWLGAIAAWIGRQEALDVSSVVACSALRRSYRDALRQDHPSVVFVELDAPRAVLETRLEHRHGHFMPASLLDSQLATLEPLEPDEPGWRMDATLPADRLANEIVARLGSA